MGAFDDLIPAGTEQAAPQRAGMFDDLIPQQQRPPQEEKGFIGRMKDKAMDVLSPYLAKLPDIVSPEEESQLRSFAMGAADPSVGAAQLLANTEIANLLTGGRAAPAVNEGIRRKEAEALAQREAAGREGFDAYRMGGAVASPPFMAAMRAPVAAGTLGRILQGGAIGAGAGAVSPVTNEDFLATKSAQVGGGAALGAAIPGGVALAKYGGSRLRNLIDPWLPGGIERAVGRTARDMAGDRADDVIAHLERAKPGQTAGEAAAGAGSAEFEGMQRIARQNAPSKYLDAAAKQTQLSKAEKQALDMVTSPMRKKALEAANIKGVKSESVLSNIDAQLSEKGIRASDVVQKTLGGIKDKISSLTKENGVIDANDLYTIRKEVGNSIATFSKETSNWDKRLTSSLERKIQGAIDEAIEKAGGRGWKQYLSEYSKGIQDIASRDVATKTAKKMEVAGAAKARDMIGQIEPKVPAAGMFNPKYSVFRAISNRLAGKIEGKSIEALSDAMLDPAKMARLMKNAAPKDRNLIVNELMANGERALAVQAIMGMSREQ